MMVEVWFWRALALIAAALLLLVVRTGQKRLAQAALVVAVAAGLGFAAAPGAGLVLAGILVGSALAAVVDAPWSRQSGAWLGWAGGAAALALTAATPAPVTHADSGTPLAVVASLLLGLAWRSIGSAAGLPLGRIALAVLLLLLPWGPDDLPVTLWRAPVLWALPGSTAAATVPGLAWTPHPGDLWAHWPQLLLAGAGLWLAANAVTAGSAARLRSAVAIAVLGIAAVALAWQSDQAPALPSGMTAVQDAPWQSDFGLFALAAWRWLAAVALVAVGPNASTPLAIHKVDMAIPGLAGLAVVALGLTAGDVAALSLPRDPAVWALTALVLAGSARLAAADVAPRANAAAALVQWLAAASLCSGALGGWSVAGLWG